MSRRILWLPSALSAVFVWSAPAHATMLTFDIFDPAFEFTENYPEGFLINQEYGDRVNSLSETADNGTTTFDYGLGAEGFTPNVEVGYGPFSIFTGGPTLWRYGFGDLERNLYQGSEGDVGIDYDYLNIRFQADPGYEVALYGFDLAGFPLTDYTIDGVSVYDGELNLFFPETNRVFFQTDVLVAGAGPSHTTFDFGTPWRGNVISLFIDARNLGLDSENIGIDNIRFGQELASSAVPEPASATLALLGALSLGGAGLRRFRRVRFNAPHCAA